MPLFVSGYKDELIFAIVRHALLWEIFFVKLLGIIIDSALTFDDHVIMVWKDSSQKLSGILRISICTSDNKKEVAIQTFF